MENKIDIYELLKKCPEGMELDCVIMDNVVFEKIDKSNNSYPIVIRNSYNFKMNLTRYGQYSEEDDYKCIIFPKGKSSWEGFTPPGKFKEGDIISDKFSDICIFKGEGNIKGTVDFYCGINDRDKLFLHIKDNKIPDLHFGNINKYNFATEEEKEKLFNVIKANGYVWNSETKTLEQLVVPKFKVDDTVRHGDDKTVITIIALKDDYYIMKSYDPHRSRFHYTKIPIKDQDQYKLFYFKFDISTLKAFESKVLVRNTTSGYWKPAFWGAYTPDNSDGLKHHEYLTTEGFTRYCIPYEGNVHLLGTTNDCSEFYKTWE